MESFDLIKHLHRAKDFSERTFGPGARSKGVVEHIRKELLEIEADPTDVEEWVDVIILAMDGAWRSGKTPEQIAAAIEAKQTKNEARKWPDWRTTDQNKAIEHDRSGEPTKAVAYGETALSDLLVRAKDIVMTPEQAEEQRRSFVYGNLVIDNPNITREMVDEAAQATMIVIDPLSA